jgi:hypothetical protein
MLQVIAYKHIWQIDLLIRNKYYLLYLHGVEQLISLHRLGERHDFLGHESGNMYNTWLAIEVKPV